MTESRDRPFVRYTEGGLKPLGIPKSGDGTARRGYGWPLEWNRDRANLVTYCRACNEFLNGYRLADQPRPPDSFDEFVAIRNQVFDQKKDLSSSRHELERERFAVAGPAGPITAQDDAAADLSSAPPD